MSNCCSDINSLFKAVEELKTGLRLTQTFLTATAGAASAGKTGNPLLGFGVGFVEGFISENSHIVERGIRELVTGEPLSQNQQYHVPPILYQRPFIEMKDFYIGNDPDNPREFEYFGVLDQKIRDLLISLTTEDAVSGNLDPSDPTFQLKALFEQDSAFDLGFSYLRDAVPYNLAINEFLSRQGDYYPPNADSDSTEAMIRLLDLVDESQRLGLAMAYASLTEDQARSVGRLLDGENLPLDEEQFTALGSNPTLFYHTIASGANNESGDLYDVIAQSPGMVTELSGTQVLAPMLQELLTSEMAQNIIANQLFTHQIAKVKATLSRNCRQIWRRSRVRWRRSRSLPRQSVICKCK